MGRRAHEVGYRVLGIDISEQMIEIARKRVPEAEFRVASVFEADLPACSAVTSIGEVLNYLFDPDNNDRQALALLFRNIYGALNPGGVFIFDIAEPEQIPRGAATKGFIEGEDWVVLLEKEEDPELRTLARRITSFRKWETTTGETTRCIACGCTAWRISRANSAEQASKFGRCAVTESTICQRPTRR